jgi:hypothetical protein
MNNRRRGKTLGSAKGRRGHVVLGSGKWVARSSRTGVFIGPSLYGVDKEYVKVVSGNVLIGSLPSHN